MFTHERVIDDIELMGAYGVALRVVVNHGAMIVRIDALLNDIADYIGAAAAYVYAIASRSLLIHDAIPDNVVCARAGLKFVPDICIVKVIIPKNGRPHVGYIDIVCKPVACAVKRKLAVFNNKHALRIMPSQKAVFIVVYIRVPDSKSIARIPANAGAIVV